MVTIYDTKKGSRKTATVLRFLLFFTFIISAYIITSFSISFFLINGYQKTISFFKYASKGDFAIELIKTAQYYFHWSIAKFSIENLTLHRYLIPKLYITYFVNFIIFTVFISKNSETIFTALILKKDPSVFGDAHWATPKEVKQMGLRSKEGLLLGQDKGGYLVANGYQHALLFAPTGGGKGVGFVIPNLLFWKESALCHDIKLENYQLTSGWRKKHLKQKVFVWEPANPDGITHCYNPVDWVSDKPGKKVDDVQKFANLVLQKKEFWENEARTLLVGVILMLMAQEDKVKSFGEVVRTLRSDDFSYAAAHALDTMADKIHPVGYMNLAAFLQKADKEKSGCVSTLNSGLELWANPLIDTATASSDFNFKEFRKILNTVYVGLTPDNIQRLKSLMSMMYQQATDFLTDKMPQKDEKYGVLFLMDEFPTLGKMEQFMAGIAYFRGYRVRLFLIVQDTQQLKSAYEESGMNSFLSNSTFRITFAANNMDTARLISDLVGQQTIENESFTRYGWFDKNKTNNKSISTVARALLLPQEVISMPRDEQIILIEAGSPLKTKKIFYYKDRKFTSRLWERTEVPTQAIIEHKRPEKKADQEGGFSNNQDFGKLLEN